MKICEFGCGKEATHLFKSSGKWCCSSNVNACEGKRKKDSENKKGINPWDGKEHPRGMLGKKSWNSGKTYEEAIGKEKSDAIKRKLSESRTGKPSHPQTEMSRKRISEKMKIVGGGYRVGSGRGKKGRYKGIWCDSSWELAFVIYCLENGKSITRNVEVRKYKMNNVERNYIPDFIVDGEVIEIKGYETEQWKCKIKSNPDIKVIGKNEIKTILDYVVEKYGKNFIILYE